MLIFKVPKKYFHKVNNKYYIPSTRPMVKLKVVAQ